MSIHLSNLQQREHSPCVLAVNFRSLHVDELKHVLYSELKHGKMGSKHVLWIWEVSRINCY
jgi:hypothetical protein